MNNWKYYNHALIPSTPPHKDPDISDLSNKDLWKSESKYGKLLFARWTTDFDLNYESGWWYCIKDTPMELENLKAKRRYEITSGLKNCNVTKINPLSYAEELYQCYLDAVKEYQNYTHVIDKESFFTL